MAAEKALWVVARHEPYRRAGLEHSRQGISIALSALTYRQIAALKEDPHLVVSEVEFDGEASEEDAAKAAAEAATEAEAKKAAAAAVKSAARKTGAGAKPTKAK
jgi:hypothetical protein